VHTPIWLADAAATWPPADVVVNLGEQPIEQPARFERIVEIVGDAQAERLAGRARWRHYVASGLTPERAGNAATTADDASASP